MMTPFLTSAALGVLLAVGILWLVRGDRLLGSYALWWLSVAIGSLVFGFFPRLIDWLGFKLGVNYPPMLLVLVVIIALLFKLLGIDIDVTRRERRMRRLLQKVAILELEIGTLREQLQARTDADAGKPQD